MEPHIPVPHFPVDCTPTTNKEQLHATGNTGDLAYAFHIHHGGSSIGGTAFF
jgi:hypothetical protein